MRRRQGKKGAPSGRKERRGREGKSVRVEMKIVMVIVDLDLDRELELWRRQLAEVDSTAISSTNTTVLLLLPPHVENGRTNEWMNGWTDGYTGGFNEATSLYQRPSSRYGSSDSNELMN